ncbi:oxygen-independent coproporphyrinogen III oxidase [Alphaproteobacteria bacterium]
MQSKTCYTNDKLNHTKSLAVYIHWPFCKNKCPYCDFNSYARQNIDHAKWFLAYEQAINYYGPLLKLYTISSVFFGGGTPSLAKPDTICNVLNTLSKNSTFSDDVEITLEANPTSIEISQLENFKNAGINRVSLGIQSLCENNLRFLGRTHSAEEAVLAIKNTTKYFDNYSLDLIYALPNQSLTSWESELKYAVCLANRHMSLYQLTIEKNTRFSHLVRLGRFKPMDNELAAELYELTQEIMNKYNLPAYEVSNHATSRYECRHNLHYWMYKDYLGIGPGAHSRITLNEQNKELYAFGVTNANSDQSKIASVDVKYPKTWLTQVFKKGHGLAHVQSLELKQMQVEAALMGLRLRQGIIKQPYFYDSNIIELKKLGLLEDVEDRVRLTLKGVLVLDSIIEILFA